MNEQVRVELHDLGKQYPGRLLFRNIQATASPGECLAVTGRNGAGKSTLLKVIAGLIGPSSGRVGFYTTTGEVPGDCHWRHLAMVSPEVTLYAALNAQENLRFLTRIRNLKRAESDLRQCLEQVELGREGPRQVGEYSTGMKQRLKFALLLATAAPLWLLDEPFSNLDQQGRALVDLLLRNALAEGRTVFLATNESREAEYAGQCIRLD